MYVRITDNNNRLIDNFFTPDFDAWGSAPEHFTRIAPTYLDALTAGATHVDVTYSQAGEETFTERHTPLGWRDGRCVGTSVTVI